MKKRSFSLLLCLVMVLSLIPSVVFAGDGTPATYTISAVSSNSAKGTVTGGGVYKEGDTATIKAIPAEGHVFDYWTSYGVPHSGTAAEFSFTVGAGTTDNFTAWFKEVTPITKMELTVAAPEAGKKPSDCITVPGFTTDPADAAVLDETSFCWYTPEGEYFNGVFEEGETYEYYMEFSPKVGYKFDFAGDNYTGDIKVNGGEVKYTESTGADWTKLACAVLVKCGPDTRVPITKMELTMAAPEAGKKPSDCITVPVFTTNPADAAALDETSFCWYTLEGEHFNGVFQEGEIYEYYMEFSPKAGYKFNFDGDEYTGDIKVNGGEVKYTESTGAGWTKLACAVLVKCESSTRAPITDIALTIDAPEAGKTAAECMFVPNITTTPANAAEFEVVDTCWYNGNGHGQFNGTFEAGKEYIYEVCLKCKDGYYFPGSGGDYAGTVSVNGEEAYYAEINNAGADAPSLYAYIGMIMTPGGTPAFLKGDVNGDGEVTDADAVYLLYNTFFGDDEYPVNQPCDFNGDGEVTDADAVYLLYYTFFGDEDYPLH